MLSDRRSGAEEPNLLDNAWLRHQVETHLLFGFFARHLGFGWVLVSVVGLAILAAIGEPWPVMLGRTVIAGTLLVLFVPLLKMSRYRQAALGWWIAKASIAIVAFILLLVGGLVGFLRGQPEAPYVTLLAFIWFPSLEFVPSLVDRQRFITLCRIALSLPIAVLASRVGNWTW